MLYIYFLKLIKSKRITYIYSGEIMKKIFLLFSLLFSLTSCQFEKEQKETTTSVVASSYIVIEQSTNKILEGFNYHETRSVASISKIMTAIVVIENSDIYETVKVPEDIKKVDGSSMYLKVNQEITIIDLLYGLLLRSGNDAAVTLALSVSKTMNEFVDLMNQKAYELNMNHSVFNNPHGLDGDDGGNLSTAYDMAILYSYCLQNPVFSTITSAKTHANYVNKNKLLRNYDYCTGGKTGFTTKAKRTLVTSASKDDIHLIVVTLNCGNDFETHRNKYEYYFNHYQSIKILNKNENSFDNQVFYCQKDYYFITNENDLSLLYQLNLNEQTIKVTLFDKNKYVLEDIIVPISLKDKV